MGDIKSKHNKSFYLIASLTVLLILSSVLLFYYNNFSASELYLGVTAFHIIVGLILFLLLILFMVLHLKIKRGILSKKQSLSGLITLVVALICIGSGLALSFVDLGVHDKWVRVVHPVSALLCLLTFVLHDSFSWSFYSLKQRISKKMSVKPIYLFTILGALAIGIYGFQFKSKTDNYVALTPEMLLPAEAQHSELKTLHPEILNGSGGCGTTNCHPDIYEQWNESMHHFSSFNNPYYKKSIEVLRSAGEGASARWCASCHDPLPLLAGKMDGNLESFDMESHLAKSGITCLACHAVQDEPHIKGNGKYVIDPVASFNKLGQHMSEGVHKTLLQANPEPHAKSMLSPNLQSEKFCLSCHKVSIPFQVNKYRWKRGQNQFDSWQRSGVSGNNIRAFYFPDKTKNCIDCHMPKVPSLDKGNDNGFVKSHRFAGANTAVPFINGHENQLHAVRGNLMNEIVALDIVKVKINNRVFDLSQPLVTMKAGDDVDMTLIMNNRKTGHRLPAGTNDTNEWWLEVLAQDKDGETILASGTMDDMGRVDDSAHFLRTILIDKNGNVIDKRNANDIYATAYNNTINPGTAQLVRFQFKVPDGASIHSIKASLKQRKFNWYYDNLTFNGMLVDSLAESDVDLNTKWVIPNPKKPEIPVTTIASTIRSSDAQYATSSPLWKRWNDYGIGLFLEGDSKEAFRAFSSVKNLSTNRADGIINMARVLVDEGSVLEAIELLDKNNERFPENKRIDFFLGKAHESLGEYEKAINYWMRIYKDSKTDFKLLLDISNAYYLLGEYNQATSFVTQALAVDPEDFGAIYKQMLIYQAQGKTDLAVTWKEKYQYYKINEKEEFIVADFLEDNPQIKIETNATHYHYLKPVNTSNNEVNQ